MEADFSRALLRGADLGGAVLFGAILEDIDLEITKGDVNTRLPDGIPYPDSWLTAEEIKERNSCKKKWRPYFSGDKRCDSRAIDWTYSGAYELHYEIVQ